MRQRTSVVAAGLVLAVGASLALSACTGSDGETNSTGSGGSETVVVWGPWSGTDADKAQQMFDAYNESQTEYTVDYQSQENLGEKLLTAIASGSVPDVVIWDRYQTSLYASKGALTAVDDRIEADGVDTSVFYEQALGEMQYEDATYGLPLIVDTRALFYNKTLFADAGLEPPTTWAELEAAAQALTVRDGSGKLTQAGFELKDAGLFNFWCYQAGCQLVADDNETVGFNTPEGLSVVEFWDKLLNQDKVYDLGYGDGSDPFAEGTLAMKYDGPWALSSLNAVDGLDYGIVEPVAGPSGDKGASMGGLSMVIPTGAKNADGAWDFMSWWTLDPEQGVTFAEISGWPPANREAAKDPFFESEDYAAFIAAMDYAKVRPNVPGFSDVEQYALTPQLQKAMSQEVTPQQALDTAETEGNDLLAKANS